MANSKIVRKVLLNLANKMIQICDCYEKNTWDLADRITYVYLNMKKEAKMNKLFNKITLNKKKLLKYRKKKLKNISILLNNEKVKGYIVEIH